MKIINWSFDYHWKTWWSSYDYVKIIWLPPEDYLIFIFRCSAVFLYLSVDDQQIIKKLVRFFYVLRWSYDIYQMIIWWLSDDHMMIYIWVSDDHMIIVWISNYYFLMVFSNDLEIIWWSIYYLIIILWISLDQMLIMIRFSDYHLLIIW